MKYIFKNVLNLRMGTAHIRQPSPHSCFKSSTPHIDIKNVVYAHWKKISIYLKIRYITQP